MDWLLDHWELVASCVLALANLILTLCVHGSSRNRINALEDKDENGIPDQLEELLLLNKKLLEALKSAKSPDSSTEEKSLSKRQKDAVPQLRASIRRDP